MEPSKRLADQADGNTSKVFRSDSGASTSAVIAFLCHLCTATFTNAFNLARHIKSIHGNQTFGCDICSKTFNQKSSLIRHRKSHDDQKTPIRHECLECNKIFLQKIDLTRHLTTHLHRPCEECGKAFQTKGALTQHRKSHKTVPLSKPGDPKPDADPRNPTSSTCPPKGCKKTALKGTYERHRVNGTEDDVDLPAFLRAQGHADLIKDALRRKKGVKIFISANIIMTRPRDWFTTGDPESRPYFTSRCHRILEATNIQEELEKAYAKIIEAMEKYLKEGSGWVVHHINFLDLVISTYRPLKGSSYIPLPKKIAFTRGVVNVKNDDQKCFLWAILSALHPPNSNMPNRVSHYQPYEHSLNMGDLTFPMSPDCIPKFEKLNNLRINLFGYQEKELFPIYISERESDPINLLLISWDENQHYCWIKDFNKLLNGHTKHEHRCFYCLYCFHRFSSQRLLDQHQESCRQHGPQKIRFPNGDDIFMKFNHTNRNLPVPYTIFADFESMIVPIQQQAGTKTERTAEHRPASVSYAIVGPDGKLTKPQFLYRGEDCVNVFLEKLKEEEREIIQLKETAVAMSLSPEEEARFQATTVCHICSKPLGDLKHRDHDHLTGEYRGAAHPNCNVNFKDRPFIPVVLHNLRGYDAHLIMQQIGLHKDSEISCLANNMEKYISFTFRTLRFIDSLQFMNESLDKLVSNLMKSGRDNFKIITDNFPQDKLDYVTAKGHFPYEYFDSLQRLEEPVLPPQTAFHSTLTNSDISDQEYAHAKEVWTAFSMSSFGDYHDLYLKTDVLLLADVFQNFRKVCQTCYGLDPCHYYTSPGLAWDAALKKSDVTLELITDPNMYLFVEEGTRGGISMISNRYAKANNSQLPDFDSNKPSTHIVYLDANNLYGWAMSQYLPVGGFEWYKSTEPINVTGSQDTDEFGYILEVDLEYPKEVHDSHSDYPLAPERMKISEEMLSPYSKNLLEELGQKHNGHVEKLVPNLRDKTKYIIHIRNLKFYLLHGMVLTKIHRALKFRQAPWLKSYIDFNTSQRALAKTEFEKNFFKLMNNAVFGKTMENLRKRRNVKLANTEDYYVKLVARPSFQASRRFCEDLVGVEMGIPSLYLNRPIYVGFTVLELSKILMYQFYYDVLKKKYDEKVKLLFTDTDSLLVHVTTEDLQADMHDFANLLDTSDYPADHPLHSNVNKKVIGKFKDEMNSIPIISYAGLRAKMYSIKPLVGADKKTAKGVARTVVNNEFHHADYERVLLGGQTVVADMAQIRSTNHLLYSLRIQKLGLSAADDKRYVLPNGRDTLAHGHYRTSIPAEVEMDCV